MLRDLLTLNCLVVPNHRPARPGTSVVALTRRNSSQGDLFGRDGQAVPQRSRAMSTSETGLDLPGPAPFRTLLIGATALGHRLAVATRKVSQFDRRGRVRLVRATTDVPVVLGDGWARPNS